MCTVWNSAWYRRRWLANLVLALSVIALEGKQSTAASIRAVYGAISATATPLWVSEDKGLFKKYGLDVELSHIPTTQAVQTLVAGGIQFTSGSSEIVAAAMAGGNTVFIAGLSNRFVMYIYGKPGLKSAADLKGKTIAVTQPDGATAVAARLALRKQGLEPEKDFKFAYIKEQPAILSALREGIVDAAVMSPPTSFQARELGLSLVVDVTSLNIPFVHSGIGTQKSYAKANPEVVRNFLKALVEAMKICREQSDQAHAVIAKYTKSTNPKLAEEAYRGFLPSWEQIPYVSRDAVQGLLDASQSAKTRNAKADDFIDNSFLRELETSGFVNGLYKD